MMVTENLGECNVVHTGSRVRGNVVKMAMEDSNGCSKATSKVQEELGGLNSQCRSKGMVDNLCQNPASRANRC